MSLCIIHSAENNQLDILSIPQKTISWIFSECPYVLSIPNIKRFVDSLFSLDCKTIRLVPPFLYEDRVQLKLNTVDLPLLPSGGFEDVVIDGTTAFCTDIEKPAMLLSSQTIISCVNSLRAPRIVFVLYVRKRGSQSHDFEPQRFSVKVFI